MAIGILEAPGVDAGRRSVQLVASQSGRRFAGCARGLQWTLRSSTNGGSSMSPPGFPLKSSTFGESDAVSLNVAEWGKFPILGGNPLGRARSFALKNRRFASPPNLFLRISELGPPPRRRRGGASPEFPREYPAKSIAPELLAQPSKYCWFSFCRFALDL